MRANTLHIRSAVCLVATVAALAITGCASKKDEHASAEQLKQRYERATQYLPWTINKHVFGTTIDPQWSADGNSVRYEWVTASGTTNYQVDLTGEGGRRSVIEPPAPADQSAKSKPAAGDDVLVAPNGRWGAKVVDNNLYRVDLSTGQQTQLTSDGVDDYVYGLAPDWASASLTTRLANKAVRPFGIWSPDGDKLLTYRVDERGMYKLPHVVPLVPGAKHQVPYVHFQNTSWPSSDKRQEAELMVFDMRTGKRINLAIPKPGVGYSPTPEGGLRWSVDGTKIFAAPETRDFRSITLYEADAATGRARAIVTDGPAATALQPDIDQGERFLPLNNGAEFIVYSERSDWGHYYLYDGKTGALKNAITAGEWTVHGVANIDEEGRWLYFLAGGRESEHDPYYSHLYRVRFDGTELALLTPENAHHEVKFSPDGRFFVDTYSTVSEPQVHVLRTNSGADVVELGHADTSRLQEQGWTMPRRFSTKAADGKTDIYGVLFLPRDFDEKQSYPLIDATYGANFRIQTPRSFLQDRQNAIALAQLGFVVMCVDGRGTPLRSQSMQDLGWGTWDLNLEDHVAAIEQLAKQHRFIDIDRVGVYGHSAGGFSTVHAMLEKPDLFKVGVASAGSHDFDLFVYPVNRERGLPKEYPEHFEPTNYQHADRLKGKLMLGHGYVDDNVHVGITLQMADALIRANKDFDLFIHPSVNHQNFYRTGFTNRKIWNYFVENLRHETPPTDIRVPDPQ
ncbi:S9 family peptidase [Steroidobacter sp.]|uniref:S9 family peptidase n=1 Tax=Steroidobacter sp. TaxID=1978227 RepID=UPI001A5FFB31|nr:DPP IV N-terminal domain-containing protein [Steroidobacter sp.]MBL8267492.1 DPP IV N-terminal domain-containing protein [Steroidobacter sp.]